MSKYVVIFIKILNFISQLSYKITKMTSHKLMKLGFNYFITLISNKDIINGDHQLTFKNH